MVSVFEWLLLGVALYWAYIFYKRWSIYRSTKRFVLEQRRKAGIPDSDRRPMAVAAADAAARRREAFERQLQEADDVFGTEKVKAAAASKRRAPTHVEFQPRPVPLPSVRARPELRPPSQAHVPTPPTALSNTRLKKREHNESGLLPSSSPVRKREADEISEAAASTTNASKAPRRVRRRVAQDIEPEPQNLMEEEDLSDATHSSGDSRSTAMDEDELDDGDDSETAEDMDMDEDAIPHGSRANSRARGAETSKKRRADVSDDHVPGDEWTDTNGLRWRIGEDGVPRRAVMVMEMKLKYQMPKDATHSDARVRVPTYVEKFLSHEEYEEAKRRNQLSWQYDRQRASVTNSPSSFQSDDTIEDSLASLVARRAPSGPKSRRARDLLFSDVEQGSSFSRSRPSSVVGDDSLGSLSVSEWSADDSASLAAPTAHDSRRGASRRLKLVRATASPLARPAHSPARAGLRGRHAQSSLATAPFSPTRTSLDGTARRQREERLLAKIRKDREAAGPPDA